jgi:PAS domain S-box-containing protein
MLPVVPPARVEVDDQRRFIDVNESACKLLGYTRQEFLELSIDDISFPSGAHVDPMYKQFLKKGSMSGIFALRRKSGEAIMVRFEAGRIDGRSIATWTHYQPLQQPSEEKSLTPPWAKPGRNG